MEEVTKSTTFRTQETKQENQWINVNNPSLQCTYNMTDQSNHIQQAKQIWEPNYDATRPRFITTDYGKQITSIQRELL